MEPGPGAPGGWLPRTAALKGQRRWDVRCESCRQETRTGGATRRRIKELVWLHKFGTHAQGWYPMEDE